MKVFDLIAKFGDCNYHNNNNLSYLTEVVKMNVTKIIELEVYRKLEKVDSENDVYLFNLEFYKQVQLQIIPNVWKGQGVLGYVFLYFYLT